MGEAPDLAEHITPLPTGVTDGQASGFQTPAPPFPGETSLPTKVKDQPVRESPSSENEGSSDLDDQLREVVRRTPLPYTLLKTGLCYDARMRFHTELNPPSQRSDFHPEDPRRILAIYKTLCHAGLADDPAFKPKKALVAAPLRRISPRYATRIEVSLVHEPQHFEFLKATAGMHEITYA